MRDFFCFWWRSTKVAASGILQRARSWWWLLAIPAVAVLRYLFAEPSTWMILPGHRIIDATLFTLAAFIMLCIFIFVIRLLIAPASLYYHEKERAGKAEAELVEKTTPKFAVSFDQERGGITTEVDKTEIHMPGIYGGMRVTSGPSFNASYLRICVTATSNVSVKNCHAFILSLEKQAAPTETFLYIDLPHPMPLGERDEPFEVMPKIPRMVDFMKVSEQDNKFIRTGYWSNALAGVFIDKATYRFTIAVNGDGITATPIKVEVVWRGEWNTISARQVQEA